MFAMLTKFVPWPYRLLALALLAAALLAFGWVKGARHVQAKWDAAVVKQSLTAASVEKKQAAATVQVVTKYVDRVRVVHDKGDTIVKEVPVYVTKQADAACILPRGFIRLHNAAAANEVPTPAGSADAAPSGVALSAAATVIADNYERCQENSAQVIGLQDYIRAMEEATK